MYNWQRKEWANFTFDQERIRDITPVFFEKTSEMEIVLQGLNSAEYREELIRCMISEAITTSEIEGEFFNKDDLMSSIKNKLGLNVKPETIKDKRAIAITNLLIAVRDSYNSRLTETEIKQWHQLLFEDSKAVNAGKWRKGNEPMQIVSGALGKETVLYEAPPSYRVPAEMKQFVYWYNSFKINETSDVLTKTAVAHLYFESIHPFEDGNGRIGRAIAEKCLAQSLGKPVLLSLSSVIEKNKKQYYAALKESQSSLEVTNWIVYFANVMTQAQTEAIETIRFSLQKAKFFAQFGAQLNDRQLKAIKKMFDAGTEGFEGGMTVKKYMSINQTSKATATRDLQHLKETGALCEYGSGRNVHYLVVLEL
jgi:Fic family protein